MNKLIRYFIYEKAAFLACLFLLLAGSGAATPHDFMLSPVAAKAYQLILNLEIEEGRKLIREPSTPQEVYVIALSEAIELIATEDRKLLPAFESAFEQRTSRKTSRGSADEMLLQAELHLQWAFVYLKFGQELDAALRLRQAYNLSRELQKKHPDYKPILKTAGLLNVLIGSVPDKYNWILSIFGMSGSVNDGLAQMETLISTDNTFSFETALWYAFIQGFALQQPEKAVESMLRHTGYHENRMAAFLLANFYLKSSSSEKALSALSDAEGNGIPLWYTHYLRGEVFLHKAEYSRAIESYASFLRHYKGQNYIKDAHYKIGLCLWLDGKQDQALIAFHEAEQSGKEATEADRYAARSLASNELPSIPLTRIRFFTDGGYYQEARELLNKIEIADLRTPKQEAEFYYRRARLEHRVGELDEAKRFYTETIKLAGNNEWYYAPNSCLQLGYIALAEKNYDAAKANFEKALSYRKHEYKNSIDSKARAGLAQVKERR